MSGVVFLLIALLISVLGSMLLWIRHTRPTSFESSVNTFSKEMRALAPREESMNEPHRFRER